MFAGHTRHRPLPATLLLTYSAKKRAESAPGVGIGTDMFMIGPAAGTYATIYDSVVTDLEKIYQDGRKRIDRVAIKLQKSVEKYVDDLGKASEAAAAKANAADQQTDASESGESPANEQSARADPTKAN